MKKLNESLSLKIIAGLILGVVAGQALGSGASSLGEIGKMVIQLIKIFATPLLFFSIVNSVISTDIKWTRGVRMLGVCVINGTLALVIGLSVTHFFRPGEALSVQALSAGLDRPAPALPTLKESKIEFIKWVTGLVPSNLLQPFSENLILTIIALAVLLGLAIRKLRTSGAEEARTLESLFSGGLKLSELILGWIVQLIPFAVFGVVAKTVGEFGFAPFKGLGIYVCVGLLGLFLHVVLVYHVWILFYCGQKFRDFWKHAREPVIYAMGTNSSLATLPLTLKALDDLKVSKQASTLGACVGTNFNNDGIILYEAMAALLVAQSQGLHLDVGQQVTMALTCLVAAMGVTGVPEAGFISLAVVLGTVGLPLDLLPLLLTVDWIIARARSMTNVLGDMTVSLVLDRKR